MQDAEHEAYGAMIHRGLEEARAYAATPEGEAQLARKLLDLAEILADDGWGKWPEQLRIAAKRLSEKK